LPKIGDKYSYAVISTKSSKNPVVQTFEFYKYIYDRELNRRGKLDDAINPIIGAISLFVALLSFFFTNKEYSRTIDCNVSIWVLISLVLLSVAISILFLVKSYNNYLIGFNYPNIAYLHSVRNFETIAIPEYNSKVDASKHIKFEDDLIDRMVAITDENIRINDRRAFSLYLAKTFIILAMAFLFITVLIIISKNTQLC
jgi:hypothetical protein